SGMRLFSDSVSPSSPELMILPARALSISDPFDTTPVTISFAEANLKISRMSVRKNGSPPVNVRLNGPSHAFSFASAIFHCSAVSSCSSGFEAQRKQVGHSRLHKYEISQMTSTGLAAIYVRS